MCSGCCSELGGSLTIELGCDLASVECNTCDTGDIFLHVDLQLDPSEDVGHLIETPKALTAGRMEGVLSSPCMVSPRGNFGVNPLDMPPDHIGSKNYISSSMRRSMSSVPGHERLDPLLNLSSFTDSFECRKRIQSGINKSTGSIENAVEKDKCFVSDALIPGKSCSDAAIVEERSREVPLKQDNFVYKRRKVRNSVTLLSRQTQTAFTKESLQSDPSGSFQLSEEEKIDSLEESEVNNKRPDKNLTPGPETSHSDKNKDILETDVNDKVDDKGLDADCQRNNSEKAGNLLENQIISKWHDKNYLSAIQTSTYLLQSGNTTKISGSNGVLYENGFGNPIEYNLPRRSNIPMSQPEFSSLLSDPEGRVKSHVTSDSENFNNLPTQGGSSLGELTYKLGEVLHNTQCKIPMNDAFVSSVPDASTAATERDFEREWCISILKESNLLLYSVGTSAAVEHPGIVGDGKWNKRCKICDSLEDSTSTLICDICEESFHMFCCNPKVVSIPKDNWYCTTCKRKRKRPAIKPSIGSRENLYGSKFQSRVPRKAVHEKVVNEKSDIFWHMLQDSEYATQVRIGKDYQADIPLWTGEVIDSAESPFIGEVVSSEEKRFELECAEYNLKNDIWPKGWKPAKLLPPHSKENWLQCRNVIYSEGEVFPDGRRAKKDIICGKWRRAPLSEIQNSEWDCSCAVVWDPVHADCAVPQELETEEILKRLKASEMVLVENLKSSTVECHLEHISAFQDVPDSPQAHTEQPEMSPMEEAKEFAQSGEDLFQQTATKIDLLGKMDTVLGQITEMRSEMEAALKDKELNSLLAIVDVCDQARVERNIRFQVEMAEDFDFELTCGAISSSMLNAVKGKPDLYQAALKIDKLAAEADTYGNYCQLWKNRYEAENAAKNRELAAKDEQIAELHKTIEDFAIANAQWKELYERMEQNHSEALEISVQECTKWKARAKELEALHGQQISFSFQNFANPKIMPTQRISASVGDRNKVLEGISVAASFVQGIESSRQLRPRLPSTEHLHQLGHEPSPGTPKSMHS